MSLWNEVSPWDGFNFIVVQNVILGSHQNKQNGKSNQPHNHPIHSDLSGLRPSRLVMGALSSYKDKKMSICNICERECKEPTHLSLDIFGSEGIDVCLNCRMAITEYVRQLRSIASVARKQEYLSGRKNKQITSGQSG